MYICIYVYMYIYIYLPQGIRMEGAQVLHIYIYMYIYVYMYICIHLPQGIRMKGAQVLHKPKQEHTNPMPLSHDMQLLLHTHRTNRRRPVRRLVLGALLRWLCLCEGILGRFLKYPHEYTAHYSPPVIVGGGEVRVSSSVPARVCGILLSTCMCVWGGSEWECACGYGCETTHYLDQYFCGVVCCLAPISTLTLTLTPNTYTGLE